MRTGQSLPVAIKQTRLAAVLTEQKPSVTSSYQTNTPCCCVDRTETECHQAKVAVQTAWLWANTYKCVMSKCWSESAKQMLLRSCESAAHKPR